MNRHFQFAPQPERDGCDFRAEVLRGLQRQPKTLPCRFFYDARGSELFEEITQLPEYYPTRTEIALLQERAAGIASHIPKGAAVVEFGSGSSRKTGLLLSALDRPRAYFPIDISAAALFPAAMRVQRLFPGIAVHPVLGGFHDFGGMGLPQTHGFHLGFFPGSTIGNMNHAEAAAFLRSVRALLGDNAAFLVGVDLKKPLDVLLPAYNDSKGVTAAFNLNILARINRELDGAFDLASFNHEAIYNEKEGRIEMHLRSARTQRVRAAHRFFDFAEGETIHTENSYKYSMEEFHTLARRSGWTALDAWTDPNGLFSLHLLA